MKRIMTTMDKFIRKQKCPSCGSRRIRFITGHTTFKNRWSITMECKKCWFKFWKLPKTLKVK